MNTPLLWGCSPISTISDAVATERGSRKKEYALSQELYRTDPSYWTRYILGNPLYVLAMLVVITGESGLVYRGYVKRGEMKELVAIKTGKGIIMQQNLKPCVNGVNMLFTS